MNRLIWKLIVILAGLSTVLATVSAAQTTYSIRRLQAPGATFTDTLGGVNNVGQVAGNFISHGVPHAYLWTNGTFKVLGLGTARNLNVHGSVVGVSAATNHATLWSNGQTRDLGALSSRDSSVALGINDNGVVVGFDTHNPTGNTLPFEWRVSTGMVRLPNLGGSHSEANGVNSLGKIVGWSEGLTGSRISVTWKNGVLSEFAVPQTPQPTPSKITNSNETIVQSTTTAGSFAIDLRIAVSGFSIQPLPSFTNIVAMDISNQGTVVGYDFDSQGNSRPFVCLNSRQVFDLNTLISPVAQTHWVLQVAQGVNDHGQIVGFGTFNGVNSGFLLTPIGTIANPSCF